MRSLRKSFVVSVDMAHGHHPNYMGKHDSSMAPKINGMQICYSFLSSLPACCCFMALKNIFPPPLLVATMQAGW